MILALNIYISLRIAQKERDSTFVNYCSFASYCRMVPLCNFYEEIKGEI